MFDFYQDLSSTSLLSDGVSNNRGVDSSQHEPLQVAKSVPDSPKCNTNTTTTNSSISSKCFGTFNAPPIPPPSTRRSPVPAKRSLKHQSSLTEENSVGLLAKAKAAIQAKSCDYSGLWRIYFLNESGLLTKKENRL